MLDTELRHRGIATEQMLDMQYLPGDNLYDPVKSKQPLSDSPPVQDRWLLDYELRACWGAAGAPARLLGSQ